MATRYAKGDRAWGICQRCGMRDRLEALLFDEQYPKLRVHIECWDMRHPQERLLPANDPVALWRPSPEDYPIEPPVLELELGSIILTWSEATSPVLNINGYNIYRSTDDGETYELIETVLVVRDDFGAITNDPTTYTDETEFDEGAVILYYVVAYSGTEDLHQDVYEARSNIADITIPETPPSTPSIYPQAAFGDPDTFVGYTTFPFLIEIGWGDADEEIKYPPDGTVGEFKFTCIGDLGGVDGVFRVGVTAYNGGNPVPNYPPADHFQTLTINGHTYTAADCEELGLDPSVPSEVVTPITYTVTSSGPSKSRVWLFPQIAELDEAEPAYPVEIVQ